MSIVDDAATVYIGDYYECEVGSGTSRRYYGEKTAMRVEPENSFALDRYAYVANNPIRLLDPSGFLNTVRLEFMFSDVISWGGEGNARAFMESERNVTK